jgi:hypothetical protein
MTHEKKLTHGRAAIGPANERDTALILPRQGAARNASCIDAFPRTEILHTMRDDAPVWRRPQGWAMETKTMTKCR